ncbi:hypothetical protein MRX96_051032 [Rhipicephalus microplus]
MSVPLCMRAMFEEPFLGALVSAIRSSRKPSLVAAPVGVLLDPVHNGAHSDDRVSDVHHAHGSRIIHVSQLDLLDDRQRERRVQTTDNPPGGTVTTTGLPRVTFDPEKDFLLKPGESVLEFCERQMEPDRSAVLPNGTWPTTALFNASRNHIQLRPVICVFDAKYWRLQEPYLPTLLPMYYCSAIVVYGYATYLDGSIVWKYPTAVPYLQALLNMTNRRQLSDRNNITVYFTLGGEREDSINLSFVAGHPAVNVDWNFPGDNCNTLIGHDVSSYYKLIYELKSSPFNVMISISPVKDRLSTYGLGVGTGMVDYAIIKTHTHIVPPSLFSVVRCSGDQLVTADVFNRALGMLPKMEDQFRLGYSISVAPETFLAPAAQLGAPVLGTMQWDNHTRQPGRTSYASVCQEKLVIRTSMHPLVSHGHPPSRQPDRAHTASATAGERSRLSKVLTSYVCVQQPRSSCTNVATFADERAFIERMKLAYADKMAMAPVAVDDIDLDDFNGKCGNGMSPLIRAIATGPR